MTNFSTVDIVELYRLTALASQQYLIDKLKLDNVKATWLISILKDQDNWQTWFLKDDMAISSLRKEVSLLLVDSCSHIPMGFQQVIRTQMDSIEREFGCAENIQESVVNNLYWEDIFQENIRVRGVQERKNYTEYRLLDNVASNTSLRKRQRSKTEDQLSKESRRVKSAAYEKDKEGTSTHIHSEHSMNHKDTNNLSFGERISSDRHSRDSEEWYRLKASYQRDPFRMAEFIQKTKCFPCCNASNFSFLKTKNDSVCSPLETEQSIIANMEETEDYMSLHPEHFDIFSCVPDVPLILSEVGSGGHLGGQFVNNENDSLRNVHSRVMDNCKRLLDIYQMKETFEHYTSGEYSNALLSEHSFVSSPTLSNIQVGDSTPSEEYVPCENILQVITPQAETETCPPQYEWQFLKSCIYTIFMQIGFTHCSQHAMDVMTDILFEKFQSVGKLLCGRRDFDGSSSYTEQAMSSSQQMVWYMKDTRKEDTLEHLLHCLYRCGLLFRVQDLLHYYSVELPYLSNTIVQVENEWRKRLESFNFRESTEWIGMSRNSSSDDSESDENNVFGEDGELSEPFRCFGYMGHNLYFDILQLQGYSQVPPNIIFTSTSWNKTNI